MTDRSGMLKNSPWCWKGSSVHILGNHLDGLVPLGLGLRRVNLEAVHLDEGGGAPGSQLHAPVAEDVQHGGALGDADGVVVLRRQQRHGVADADALGALGDGAVEHFRRGAVGELPQEVVFHRPEVLEANLGRPGPPGPAPACSAPIRCRDDGARESVSRTSGRISCVNPHGWVFQGHSSTPAWRRGQRASSGAVPVSFRHVSCQRRTGPPGVARHSLRRATTGSMTVARYAG